MTKSGQKRLLQMALLSILIVAISAATVTANENGVQGGGYLEHLH